MMLRLALLLGFVATTAPAHACMARKFEDWVFAPTPPTNVPIGLMVLKVVPPTNIIDGPWNAIEVKLAEPVVGYDGKVIWISPGLYSTCSRWGTVGKTAYVVGHWSVDKEGRELFSALDQKWQPQWGQSADDR